MVVLFHFVWATTGFVSSKTILEIFKYGKCGVHIFFVISGFIIPYSLYSSNYKIQNFFKFVLKRIIRLDPPYIVSIILVIVVAYCKVWFHYEGSAPNTVTLPQVALHLGYLINFFPQYHWLNNVYWTLAIEFQYYLLMALVVMFFTSSNIFMRLIMYALFLVGPFIPAMPMAAHFPLYAPLFLMGILVFQYKKNIITNIEFWIVFVLATVLVYIPLKEIVFFGLFAAFAILFFENVHIKFLSWLGKFSYSVYLIHPVIGASVVNILSHHVTGLWQKIGVVLIGIVVTLVSSLIMYWLIEKPSKKISSSIKF